MALGSSIFKATVNLANLDEQIYEDISLTIALHPSETEERMMIRICAFLFSFEERLEFSDGLNNPDSPDAWKKNLMGDVEHWIEIGQPDDKKIRKACGRSERVSVFSFNSFKTEAWFEKIKTKIKKNKNLEVFHLGVENQHDFENLVARTMNLNCVIEDKAMFLSDENLRVQISQEKKIF